jgi:hypothetical protein
MTVCTSIIYVKESVGATPTVKKVHERREDLVSLLCNRQSLRRLVQLLATTFHLSKKVS